MDPQEWQRIFKIKAESLHPEHTWQLEFDDNIKPKDPNPGWEQYNRKTSARFRCTCGRPWPSNRVMVIFHMQLIDTQGTVKVRPLRQSCNKCTDAPMVKPSVESDNIEVLMENLMKEIQIRYYGEIRDPLNRPFRRLEVNNDHEPDHCEGCRMGICATK